ncbi:MAG: elongation factor G [Planctomycetota bacterium]|nr:MAG: elongation factor G [Planctomycetota bacterium]
MSVAIGDYRNIALVGHSGAGKTSLAEAMLFKTGVTTRLCKVDDGTSTLDFDEESRERKHSLDSSVTWFDHAGKRFNVVDTPGIPDFCGPAIAALAAVETAVIVVSATAGVGVMTRRMFKNAGDYGLARVVVVNRIGADGAALGEVLESIRETFGRECYPVNLPAEGATKVIDVMSNTEGSADILDVAQCHTELIDAIVETDESLMEEYMEQGTVPAEKLRPAVAAAVASGHVIPVFFTDALHDVGVQNLLDELCLCAPSPLVGCKRKLVVGQGEDAQTTEIEPSTDGEFIAQVFKITADPRSNIKYSCARVHRGSLGSDGQVVVGDARKGQRIGHLFKLRGGETEEISTAEAGDIVAFAKIDMSIGDVLRSSAGEGEIPLPQFTKPMFALAIEPKSRGDADKITQALSRFAEEDPCFEYHRDDQTHELVMQGIGDQHLAVIQSKMKRYFKLEIDTKPPKIPYRETISGTAKYVEYTHKKQSGGAGQYAKVVIDLAPTERGEGYKFEDKIYGGAIDQAYRPSVDKGIRDQMKRGVIAGYPVVDVHVSLVDGKTHPVDSKDVAFQIAGRQVFKKAFAQCKPILLEPIVNLEVTIPAEFVGDITRDISGKRGQILGQDQMPGNQVVIKAQVPLAEVANYSSQLKSATAGQGSYMMELSHYDVVPPNVQQQIVAAHKPGDDDE